MNNFNMSDSRNRRNLLYWTGFFPFHSVTNYSSDVTKMKLDMKNTFGDGLYISNLHLIPDPLKKNLADSIITGEVKTKTNMASETKTSPNDQKRKEVEASDHRIDSYPSLAGITSFFSGVLSFVSGAMFHKRANSPTQYYECFEQNFDEMTPSLQAWQHAKSEDQNKNGRAHNVTASTNDPTNTHNITMDLNCKIKAARCEDKLNQVRLLLTNHHTPQYQPRLRPRRPRKVFVEPNSIEDCFEDAFSPEDFETLPNDTILEYYSPLSYQNPELLISDAPQINTKYLPVTEPTEISNTLPDINEDNNIDIYANNEKNVHIVSSCEDKINALKVLLNKRQSHKSTTGPKSAITTEPTQKEQKSQPITIQDNYTDEIISSVEKKKENNTIEGDKTFNQLFVEDVIKDINSSDLNNSLESQDDQCSDSSPEYLDPSNYFDEVTGRFYSTSATDSEDSFQIVFTDSPRSLRKRNLSDCDSEDSFIVFEDSPDSCYLSNDVFGDELSSQEVAIDSSDFDNTDESDNLDSESDSGCDSYHPTCKLSHSLTRTIGDLTDDSLYEADEDKGDEDEVDCAPKFTVENVTSVIEENEGADAIEMKPRGLLIDEKRKLDRKKQPAKNVHFSPHPPKVHVMRVWAFAARQARAGHWERHALDRERFKRRIADVDMAVSWVLKPQHRSRVMFQRFMPWWNAQKRKELAEKKQKELEEKNAEVNNKISDMLDAEIVTESDVKVEANDTSDANIVTEPDVNANNVKKYKITLNTEIKDQSKKIVNGFKSNIELRGEPANINTKTDISEKSKLRETHKVLKDNEIELIDNKKNALKLGIPGKDIDALTT